jgi:hypothetical protein
MRYGKYRCRVCNGEGEVECCCCDETSTCRHCGGEHYDPDLIDMPAYKAACRALTPLREHSGTWAIQEGRSLVGRTNGRDKVLVESFVRIAARV